MHSDFIHELDQRRWILGLLFDIAEAYEAGRRFPFKLASINKIFPIGVMYQLIALSGFEYYRIGMQPEGFCVAKYDITSEDGQEKARKYYV